MEVPLTGEGTQEGIVRPAELADVPASAGPGCRSRYPIGIQLPETVNISNLGTVTQTITSVIPPEGAVHRQQPAGRRDEAASGGVDRRAGDLHAEVTWTGYRVVHPCR